jgi:hypothetical protein
MEAQKSIRKRVMAEITEEQPPINTLSTIVQSGRKGFVSLEKHAILSIVVLKIIENAL